MSQNDTGRAGVVHAPSDGNGMDKLASAILDDMLYNILHDLIMKTHRDEKQSRSATAAIRVETLANEAAQDLAGATGESKPEGHHETDAAEYENGQVSLKGNPLKTTPDILCPRCHLPRLLYPIDGIGARKPDPNATYCKKHPYINKPGCDIYGQMWVAPGPGRGKKKKDFDKKVSAAISAATTGIDSGTGAAAEQRPPNVLSFPSATCSKCKRCILVSRLNNHMGSCIGNSGRNASRAAAAKISNGGNGGHGNGSSMVSDNTPPASQKGTPMSSSHGSPRKRDADDFDDDGGGYDDGDMNGSGNSKPTKKKFKSSASGSGTGSTPSASPSQGLSVSLTKKLTLKMKNAAGGSRDTSAPPATTTQKKHVPKGKPSSSVGGGGGRKISDNYDDDDDDGDDDDIDEEDNDNSRDYIDDGGDEDYDEGRSGHNNNRGSHSSYGGSNSGNRHRGSSMKLDLDDDDDGDGEVRSSINYKAAPVGANASGNPLKLKKKKLLVSSANTAMSAGSSPLKKTTKVPIPIPGTNGTNGTHKKAKAISKTPLSPPASKNGRARDMDAGSESSGTMSSPRN